MAAAWLDMLPKHQVDTDNGEVETQLKMERYVLSDPARQKQAIRAYLAFVRAYSTHTKETKVARTSQDRPQTFRQVDMLASKRD